MSKPKPDDVMDTLAGEWKAYSSIFSSLDAKQLAISKNIFYCGAIAMSSLIGRGFDCEGELTQFAEALRREMVRRGLSID